MLDDLRKLSIHFLSMRNTPYRRYLLRTADFSHRLSILIGQRGVGKTTTLVQNLLSRVGGDILDPRILYIQADHFQIGLTSLYAIAEHFHAHGGVWIAFDKIHKYSDWSLELKSIYDTFPHLNVLASGSSALEIHRGTHDLTRRAIVHRLLGLSFREYLELVLHIECPTYSLEEICVNHQRITRNIVSLLEQKEVKILPLFEKYLRVGFFPYFLDLNSDALYLSTLEQNLHTTIESDLAAIYPNLTALSINKIKKLLAYIANAVPFTPNWHKIMTVLEIGDTRTLKSYFEHLEEAGLIRCLTKASNKFHQLENPAKIFLNNTNQLYAIAPGTPQQGTLRETFFLSMLSKDHEVRLPNNGDFLVDDKLLFEIGGKSKKATQLKRDPHGYLACSDTEHGIEKKIPLWLFGLLY